LLSCYRDRFFGFLLIFYLINHASAQFNRVNFILKALVLLRSGKKIKKRGGELGASPHAIAMRIGLEIGRKFQTCKPPLTSRYTTQCLLPATELDGAQRMTNESDTTRPPLSLCQNKNKRGRPSCVVFHATKRLSVNSTHWS
jgi:hypothetical protein